jgi:hypothetical protein
MSEFQQLKLFDTSIYMVEIIGSYDGANPLGTKSTRKVECIQLELDLFSKRLVLLSYNNWNELAA